MNEKKLKAIQVVIEQSVASAGLSALPTPGFETGKHAFLLSVNEISMCVRIANVYSGSKIGESEMKEVLLDTGLAISTGGGLAFIATQAGRGIVNEMLNFVPVVGWVIKGIIASSLSAMIGASFIAVAEEQWR